MKRLLLLLVIGLSSLAGYTQTGDSRIQSRIDTVDQDYLLFTQSVLIQAPLTDVWDAYTTKQGWESWVAPLAEIDWKINGTIQTNYNPAGRIGDSTTIVTNIINYIPQKMITLQAEISDNFPAFMKEDARDFYNVITFEVIDPTQTQLNSYGIGYRNEKRYLDLLNYFKKANESTLMKLISYLEE